MDAKKHKSSRRKKREREYKEDVQVEEKLNRAIGKLSHRVRRASIQAWKSTFHTTGEYLDADEVTTNLDESDPGKRTAKSPIPIQRRAKSMGEKQGLSKSTSPSVKPRNPMVRRSAGFDKASDLSSSSSSSLDSPSSSMSTLEEIDEEESSSCEGKGTPKAVRSDAITVHGWHDLPAELQQKVRRANIVPPTSIDAFKTLLCCLYFRERIVFEYVFATNEAPFVVQQPKQPIDWSSLPASTELLSQNNTAYDLVLVGKGAFGEVFKGTPSEGGDSRCVAIKQIAHNTDKAIYTNFKEATALRRCDHKNIVQYRSCWEVKDEFWLATEYLDGINLSQAVKLHKFDESYAAYIAEQMLKGIAYLHAKGFVHRDLKSSNIMLTREGEVKIIDFGLCVFGESASPCRGMVGSALWMAPEMFACPSVYNWQVDIWAFTLCVCEIINRCPPSRSHGLLSAVYTVATQGYTHPFRENKISESLKAFAAAGLQHDPAQRPSAVELKKHEWLKGGLSDGRIAARPVFAHIIDIAPSTLKKHRRRRKRSAKKSSNNNNRRNS